MVTESRDLWSLACLNIEGCWGWACAIIGCAGGGAATGAGACCCGGGAALAGGGGGGAARAAAGGGAADLPLRGILWDYYDDTNIWNNDSNFDTTISISK